MQESGMHFANAWGSIKIAAQIYNAARKEKFLEKTWDDMELLVKMHGERTVSSEPRPAT